MKVPEIGPVLKRLRKERKLTLERLAAISGVSRSMLSHIERGQANPTFAVLWSLTRALKVEFSDLAADGSPPAEASSIELVTAAYTPLIRSGDETCRLSILSPPQTAGKIEWYALEVSPGGTLDSAAHPPGTQEHFTAMTPGLEVTSGGAVQHLEAGETARYPADVPHRIANTSDEVAKGILVAIFR